MIYHTNPNSHIYLLALSHDKQTYTTEIHTCGIHNNMCTERQFHPRHFVTNVTLSLCVRCVFGCCLCQHSNRSKWGTTGTHTRLHITPHCATPIFAQIIIHLPIASAYIVAQTRYKQSVACGTQPTVMPIYYVISALPGQTPNSLPPSSTRQVGVCICGFLLLERNWPNAVTTPYCVFIWTQCVLYTIHILYNGRWRNCIYIDRRGGGYW